MLNAAIVQKQLEDLASHVEKAHPETADLLRDLGDAVQGGPNADAWAFCDIRAVINSGKISSVLRNDASNDVIVRGFEVARNSLVLLPLAVTWFGIAVAVDAYFRLISDKPALAAQSFIYLWQSGFEGRTLLSLGTLAFIDGFLLTLVFLLTLAVYARSAWLSLNNRRLASLDSKLDQIIPQVELVLAPRRAPQPYATIHQLEQNVERLLNEIATERQRLDDLAKKREKELGDLKDFAKHLKQGAETMLSAAQSLESTQTQNQTSIAELTGAIKGLSDTQQNVLDAARLVAKRIDALISQQQQASQDAISATERVIGEQQKAARDIATQVDGLIATQQAAISHAIAEQQQATQRISMQIEGIIAEQQRGIQEIANRIEGLMAAQERAAQEYATRIDGLTMEQQRAVQSLDQYTAEHKAASDVIVNALDVFSQSTKDLSGVSAIAQSLATEQGNLIQALAKESEAQARVAEFVSRATAGVENALLQINESSTTIRGIAADLTTIAQTLPSILNPIQVDLVNIFREYRDTTEAISRASATLETATQTLTDAVAALQQRSAPYKRP